MDIFDGGPTVHCECQKIRSIAESRQGKVSTINNVEIENPLLVSNSALDFRCCLGHVQWNEDGTATIDEVTALRLNVKRDDLIRTVEPKSSAGG